MSILIKNIKGLIQVEQQGTRWKAGAEMAGLPVLQNAYLHLEDGLIGDYGRMEDMPSISADNEIDAQSRFVFPSFVDSHSHIVFAGSREGEFVDKIRGLSYEEIAKKGGGILNSARQLQHTSAEELYDSAIKRVREVIGFGTGALEIKSGYGLTTKDELKMLRVAKRISETTPLTIKTTFLGAHAIPAAYRDRKNYVDLVIHEMIPAVAEEALADYCDVFCEKGFFTAEETEKIVEQGKRYGLKPKIHANQLSKSGGVQVGVRTGAISVDHLENMGAEEIKALKGSKTMATLLPGAAFFLGTSYPPAREMLRAGLPLALATDYNPGSAPCGRMSLMLSLACIKMKMTPEEAINAATINGAYAMEILNTHGSISRGKSASVFITRPIPSYAFLPYAFGSDLVDQVILNGKLIATDF